MLCTHRGLHIPTQKQLLTIKAVLSLCALLFWQRGWDHSSLWMERDTVYFQRTVLQHIQPPSVLLNLWLQHWWFVVYDLWFFGLRKQTYPACVNISGRKKPNKTIHTHTQTRFCSILMGCSEATNLYRGRFSHITLYSLEWTLKYHQQTNLSSGQFNSRHNHSMSFSQLVDSCDIVTWKLNLKWSCAQKVWNSHSTVVHTLKLKIPAGWTKMPHLNQLTVHMPEKLPVYSLHGLWTIFGLITTQFDWGLKKDVWDYI